MNIKTFLFFILTTSFFNQFVFSDLNNNPDSYDEVFKKENEVRDHYRKIYDIYKKISNEKKEKLVNKSVHDFMGDNALLPLPRIIEDEEYEIITRGVKQRGKAIEMFLKEYYGKGDSWKKVIPKNVLDSIIDRNGESTWKEYIRPWHIEFWYGPDLIRAKDGKFYVVEDNPGFIGGIGDLITARESLLTSIPEYKEHLNSPKPINFYKDLSLKYRERAKNYDGIPVILEYTKNLVADNEDVRVKQIFEDEGIEVVRINILKRGLYDGKKRVTVDKNGVWLEIKKGHGRIQRKRVGFVVLNMEPLDLYPGHPGNHPKRVLEEASDILGEKELEEISRKAIKELMLPDEKSGKIDIEALEKYLREESGYITELDEKRGVKGIFNAFFDGKVGLKGAPGIDFIGDKEFYIYVEDLILHYLKEAPIIKNMETGSFRTFINDKETLDEITLKRIFKNIEKYVIKGVGGRGGDAVWIGKKMPKGKIEELKKLIISYPSNFIHQEFNSLSVLDGHIVDLRIISAVIKEGIITAPVPWGRAVPIDGDGKVNISATGKETAVFISKHKDCHSLMDLVLIAP